MKIIKFNGGLGNQFFQYAFGLALEDYYNEEIYYDVTNYNLKDKNSCRPFLLNKYKTHIKFANKRQRKKCVNENSKLKNNINKIFNKIIFKENSNRLIEKNPQFYDKTLFLDKKDIYFEGFFQTEKYFKHLKNKVLDSFVLLEPLDDLNKNLLNEILSQNAISVHIRRGDYLLNNVFNNCNIEYYTKAINHMAKKEISPYFYIFSDDSAWVKENFKINYPMQIVDINKDNNSYYDIELMRNCKHNITCNSTFSWWGAWLNTNPNKIVITPQNYYINRETYDIIPEEWIKY